MLSKFVAWLLAAVTALMGNFAYYKNPEKSYTTAGLYTVAQDPVDYAQMRTWYMDSLGGEAVCNTKGTHLPNNNQTTSSGFMHIISGTPLNTSASIELVYGDVIIAPTKCKITSEPSESIDKIVVEAENQLSNSWWKMEIYKPQTWFCCYGVEPLENGRYQHSQEDHKVVLSQGDVLAVAGEETTLKLWCTREGQHKETKDYAEFMHDTTDAFAGQEGTTLSGKDKITGTGGVQIDKNKIFKGEQTWHTGAPPNDKKWWYGGTRGWAANQYVVIDDSDGQQRIYYFDESGWMVTGWGSDGYYYSPVTDHAEDGSIEHKEGQLLVDAIVPAPNGVNYVKLDLTGKIVKEQADGIGVEYGNSVYKWSSVLDAYTQTGNEVLQADPNFSGGQNIDTWGTGSGWEGGKGAWYYKQNGNYYTGNSDGTYYMLQLDTTKYFLDVNSNRLAESPTNNTTVIYYNGNPYIITEDMGAPLGWVQNKSNKIWHYNKDSGAIQNGWFQDSDPKHTWYYFKEFDMVANITLEIDGKPYHFDNSGACTNP